MPDPALSGSLTSAGNLRVGIDIVQISRITESVDQFGRRFLERVFTAREISYALAAPAMRDQRLAARFAAKEAALKALGLADRGIAWTQIEVMRTESGRCHLKLHGAANETAQGDGIIDIAMSMSHEGDYATAIVMAMQSKNQAT